MRDESKLCKKSSARAKHRSLNDVLLETVALREAVFDLGVPELIALVDALLLGLGQVATRSRRQMRCRGDWPKAA